MNRRTSIRNAAAALAAAFLPRVRAADQVERSSERIQIEIRDFVYAPAHPSVRVGQIITFINRDIAPHTATATDGSWDTGNLNLNESATITVSEDMQTRFLCRYHPNMSGQLQFADEA